MIYPQFIFEGIWSNETHPRDYPFAVWLTHFSDVIGASHDTNFSFWGENHVRFFLTIICLSCKNIYNYLFCANILGILVIIFICLRAYCLEFVSTILSPIYYHQSSSLSSWSASFDLSASSIRVAWA